MQWPHVLTAAISVWLCSSPIDVVRCQQHEMSVLSGVAQVEAYLRDHDFVVTLWRSKHCSLSDKIEANLEIIREELEEEDVEVVKVLSRKVAKKFNVTTLPCVILYRGGTQHALTFDGNPLKSAELLEFLTDEETLQLPDKIEKVSVDDLSELTAEEPLVAAIFYEEQSEKSRLAMEVLEAIDDEAAEFQISVVRISDAKLAEEYSLNQLPALVYFRQGVPLVFGGAELSQTKSEEIFEFLFQNRFLPEVEQPLEEVDEDTLETLLENIDRLLGSSQETE